MSQQFITRIINHVVNEVLVKGLAESRTFQRFAMRTQTNLDEAKKAGTEYMSKSIEQLEKMTAEEIAAANAAAGPPQPPLRGMPGFLSAFGKEVRKDVGMGK